MLVSRMSEIRPEKDYPELSAICPNEMHYSTKSVVGNASVSIQRNRYNYISRLHVDRDACKGNTDIPKEATQGCSATLNPVMVPKPTPMATNEDGQRQKQSARGTTRNLFAGGCQASLSRFIMCRFISACSCCSVIMPTSLPLDTTAAMAVPSDSIL